MIIEVIQRPSGGGQSGTDPTDVLRPAVVVSHTLDELLDLIVIDEVSGRRGGFNRDDLPHHLFDLILGQWSVPQ